MTPTILTASGHYFNLLNPEQCHIHIADIAHALSHLCRFTGHTRQFYSVAQHSVLVSHLVPQADAMAALLHDAAESYLGDVASPLKALLPDYRAIEARVEAAVFARFGLPATLPASIKHADRVALATEKRDVLHRHPPNEAWELLDGIAPHASVIHPLQPALARAQFLRRYMELTEQRYRYAPHTPHTPHTSHTPHAPDMPDTPQAAQARQALAH